MEYIPQQKVEREYLDNSASPLHSVSAVPASVVSPELIILHKRQVFSARCTLGVSIQVTLSLKVKKKIFSQFSIKRDSRSGKNHTEITNIGLYNLLYADASSGNVSLRMVSVFLSCYAGHYHIASLAPSPPFLQAS